MQGFSADDHYAAQRTVVSVILLGIVVIFSPFAVLQNNNVPHIFPLPPGWVPSVMIYIWAAQFGVGNIQDVYILEGGITNLHAIPFVIITLIFFVIQIAVGMRKMQAKYGVAIEMSFILIWISVCQLIYGSLQEYTLIQIPLLPIVGISIILLTYWYQEKR